MATLTTQVDEYGARGVQTSAIPTVVPEYTDNAAALAAGLVIGRIYRTGDILKIVH